MVQRRALDLTLAVAVLLGCFPSLVAAAPEEADDEIGVNAGIGFPDESLVGHDGSPGPLLGARYGHVLTDRFGVSGDVLYSPKYNGTLAFGDVSEMALGGSLDWFFRKKPKAQWFLSPGVGWASFNPDQGSSVDGGFFSLAIGQRIWPGDPGANLRWTIRADEMATSGDGGVGRPFTLMALLGASIGFGGPPPDADKDGVPNRKDKCPDTPAGAKVDEKGCPKDSDGDGVYDGLDKCPDTPKDWPVDETGCPKDTDGDGVPDGKDTCPNTLKGAKVDEKGCPLDADGDGVFDGLDSCPDTPKGAKVDEKGCPLDADGDGVFDGIDTCPDTPKGVKVDAKGCPLDADGDGVFDGTDRCPDTPKGTKVDATGCPEKAPPLFTPEKKSLILEGVNFEYDSATLSPDSFSVLDRVATSLKDWPEVRVEIGGYTDSRGSDAYNAKLSGRRAEAVRQYLVAKGVAAERMTAKGYGEAKPIADNATEEGRARNRRVELKKLD